MYRMILIVCVVCFGCGSPRNSDTIQREQQETLLREGTAAVGMPAVKNFRERRLLKDIIELRDQEGLTTFAYLFNEREGKLIFFGETVGYPIPYATQFTNPQRPARYNETSERGNIALPQADPSGLFTPSAAEGTWIMMKDPSSNRVSPVYVEPRLVVMPFKLKV